MSSNGNGNGAPTERQLVFVDNYLDSFNATRSYMSAYNAKEKTAAVNGCRLLRNAKVAKLIKARLEANHMGEAEVATRLADRARFNVGDYLKEGGLIAVVDLERVIADGHGQHIKGIKYTPKGGALIEFYPSDHALELLGKVHGMFRERHDITSGGEKIVPLAILNVDPDKL